MKKIILITLAISLYSTAFSQQTVSVDSLSKYIGDTVTVCSKVYSVKVLDKLTFINVGARYPGSPLTLVIFKNDFPKFKGTVESMFADKNICVTDLLQLYKEKTEIIIKDPAQIVIQ